MVNEGAHNWSIILPGEGEEDWPSCVCATHKHTTAITLTIHLDWRRRWGVAERLSAADEDGRGKLNVTLVPNGPFGPVLHVIWWRLWFFFLTGSLGMLHYVVSHYSTIGMYEMFLYIKCRIGITFFFPKFCWYLLILPVGQLWLIVIFWQWKLSRHNRYSFNFIQCPQAVWKKVIIEFIAEQLYVDPKAWMSTSMIQPTMSGCYVSNPAERYNFIM